MFPFNIYVIVEMDNVRETIFFVKDSYSLRNKQFLLV